MEDWKLQHYLTNFTEACKGEPHALIKHAKKLIQIRERLRNEAQITQLLDEVFPYLDDASAPVRQCAACIIIEMPVTPLSTMPPNFDIKLYDRHGKIYYSREWEDTALTAKQSIEWQEFVAGHARYLREHSEQRYLG